MRAPDQDLQVPGDVLRVQGSPVRLREYQVVVAVGAAQQQAFLTLLRAVGFQDGDGVLVQGDDALAFLAL